jgi:hypothetical protein
LSQPGRVGDIGLAAGQVLDVSRIDKQHIESGVLQQVVERLPVVASGFHHRASDLLSDQMLTQRKDLARYRAPGRHRLYRLAPARTGDSDAHLGVLF